MTTKNTVLVDIDNTIAKTQIAYVRYANSAGTTQFVFEQITKEFSDDPDDEFEALVRHFITSTDYRETVESIEPYDVLEAFEKLKSQGFRICIASSRIENWHESTAQWLDNHNLLPYVDQLYLRTSDIDSVDFKEQAARATQAIAAFDDSYHTALVLTFIQEYYLIDQPWNRNVRPLPNLVRAASFAEAVNAFLASRHGR